MAIFSKMNGGQVIVFTRIEYLVVVGEAWSNQFCHPSFYNSFNAFRVLKLITDGYTVASADQLWEIGI